MNPPLTVHHGQELGFGVGQNGALGRRHAMPGRRHGRRRRGTGEAYDDEEPDTGMQSAAQCSHHLRS